MTLNRVGVALRGVDGDPPDIYLDDTGNLAMVEDALAVGQHIKQRVKTFSGEWFLDTAAGVAWLTEVLGKNYDPVIAEALIKVEVLETDGVVDIESFSVRFDQTSRGLIADNITVNTEYDEKVST